MEQYTLGERVIHAWDAFTKRDPTPYEPESGGWEVYRTGQRMSYTTSPQTIKTSVYNQLAVDAALLEIRHVKVKDGHYQEDIDSQLNYLLTQEANLDQSSFAFFQDVVMSLFDEGVVALVPVKASMNPSESGSYDIKSLRTARIVDWYPSKIKVEVYNEDEGKNQEVIVDKEWTAIIENPLYAVMNEPNSTLRRLVEKLALLDSIDKQSGSGKLDIIIQMPYVIKNERKRKQAEERRKSIETQLAGSQYGIAYTDGTEKVIQLNRPAENNLMEQVEYLTSMLYSQLGLTKEVFEGTADEKTMINYYNRSIAPILKAIVGEINRKFLTKTARTQGQAVMYFRDPFKMVPVSELADIADKFTRNEIFSPNDIRSVMGVKPAKDPKADELRNRNINNKGEEMKVKEGKESNNEV